MAFGVKAVEKAHQRIGGGEKGGVNVLCCRTSSCDDGDFKAPSFQMLAACTTSWASQLQVRREDEQWSEMGGRDSRGGTEDAEKEVEEGESEFLGGIKFSSIAGG